MYLGLDLGTSGMKALAVDTEGGVAGEATVRYDALRPGAGLSEQDPDTWTDAACAAVDTLCARCPELRRELRAIGLSGQMHSLVALGEDDRPLRPAILWNDARGGEWAAAAPEATRDLTGVGPMTSFTAAKLHWLRRAEPDIFAALRRIALPKDALRLWLTGEWATDPSDAAGTQLYDQGTGAWAPEMVEALGLDPAVLPPVRDAAAVAGRLRPAAAEALGLPSVPVATGAADTPCGALAVGCTDASGAMISLGTGALILAGAESYAPPPGAGIHHFAHALPDRWYRMGAVLSCGAALDWMARITGQETAAALAELEARGWAGPGAVTAVPYLDGVRTPHGDPEARAVLAGLAHATDRRDLMQAMLEGVCYALADAAAALEEGGAIPDRPVVIGGGTRSALWLDMLATILGRELGVAEGGAGGSALGAARLAMLGDGQPRGGVLRSPATRTVAPRHDLSGPAAAGLERFRAARPLSRALRPPA